MSKRADTDFLNDSKESILRINVYVENLSYEEFFHNPVFLFVDIRRLSELVKLRNLDEKEKPASRERLAVRIMLLHEIMERGIQELLEAEKGRKVV